jgi:osmotically-inducible protein OsmY
MKNIKHILTGLCAIGLLAGCSRSSDERSANEASDPSLRSRQSNSATLSATSRDTDSSRAYSQETNSSSSFKDADNTGRNVRDRSDATLTAEDQGNSESDREITRQIRRALTTNDQFSTTAKNIKIVTVNGKTTLRGPVQSEQEKQAVASAAQNAGAGAVENQLEVKANQ